MTTETASSSSEPSDFFDIPDAEMIQGYKPKHTHILRAVEYILGHRMKKNADYQEDQPQQFTVEYDPELELSVSFVSRYPKVIAECCTDLERSMTTELAPLSLQSKLRRVFLESCMDPQTEKIVTVGSLAKGMSFIHISKYPRDKNEQHHILKEFVATKRGKKGRKMKLPQTESGQVFMREQLVLVPL